MIFAGAGISRPAGLPLFDGLVQQVEEQLGFPRTEIYSELIEARSFDKALALIEEGHGRSRLFGAVVQALSITDRIADVGAHRSLLEIATTDDGGPRLVTTNFDRLFLEAAGDATSIDVAPRLPIPRKTRWRGVVYLHGLIPAEGGSEDDLILTSADFGRAYLVDRWAARFVSELFRNFRVLFVGYGVDDPVMRYLLDALAAEKARGETGFREAYALVGEPKDALGRARWAQKGVRALFYDPADNHGSLYRCFDHWAELCREGLQARVRWALRYAHQPPDDPQSDEVRLTAWALADGTGTALRKWAAEKPSIDWLKVFEQVEEDLGLDLIIPRGLGHQVLALNDVGRSLMGWLRRLMMDEETRLSFLDWFLERQGRPHPEFCELVQRQLWHGSALPESYRIVWRVLTRPGRCFPMPNNPISLTQLFTSDDLPFDSVSVRLFLREALAIEPRLRRGIGRALLGDGLTEDSAGKSIHYLVDRDLEFVENKTGFALRQLLKGPQTDAWVRWDREFFGLLDESVEWLALLGLAEPGNDGSSVWLESLSGPYSEGPYGVRALILAASAKVVRARVEAVDRVQELILKARLWATSDYPLYWRLAFHASTHGQQLSQEAAEELLAVGLGMLRDERKLWNFDARRDVAAFLRTASPQLPEQVFNHLLQLVRSGRPRENHLTDEQYRRFSDREIWRFLQAIQESGRRLPDEARAQLDALSKEIPPEPEPSVGPAVQTLTVDFFDGGERRKLATENPEAAVDSMKEKLASGEATDQDWNNFLFPWISNPADRDHALVLELVTTLDAEQLHLAARSSLADWFREAAKVSPQPCPPNFCSALKGLLDVALTIEPQRDDLISEALNHSAGRSVDAVLDCLWKTEGLGDDFKRVFELVLTSDQPAGPVARIPLGRVVGFLYARDEAWTSEWLLPLFRKPSSDPENEALWLWKSFLRSGQLDVNLLYDWKDSLLEFLGAIAGPANNYQEYAFRLLVSWSLEFPDLFSKTEVNQALSGLGPEGFEAVARALVDSLKSSNSPGVLWKKKVRGWIGAYWPAQKARYSTKASDFLAWVPCYSGEALPDAVQVIAPLLRQDSDLHFLSSVLRDDDPLDRSDQLDHWKLVKRYPESVLTLVHSVRPSQPASWALDDLEAILEQLEAAQPRLRQETEFLELERLCRLSRSK